MHQSMRDGSFGIEDSTVGLKAVHAAGIGAVAVTHPSMKNHDKSFSNLGVADLNGEEHSGLRDITVGSNLKNGVWSP